MKELEKKLYEFANKKGTQVTQVFDDLLDYIIGYFDPEGKPIVGWGKKYSKEDNEAFAEMMQEYFMVMKKALHTKEWYDAFGDLFMSLQTRGGGRGQFFTPSDLCDMMASISLPADKEKELTTKRVKGWGERVTVADCACGSARNLLAAHAVFIRNEWKKPYLVAEDIDYTCCKMSAINMCVHGCYGEVVCHNTLTEPTTIRKGFIINEGLYPLPNGMPTIRRTNDTRQFYLTHYHHAEEAITINNGSAE